MKICSGCDGPIRETGAMILVGRFGDSDRRAAHYCEWCTAVLSRWQEDHAAACRAHMFYRTTGAIAFHVRSLVCRSFSVSDADLVSRSRVNKVATARAVAMHLTRRVGRLSTPETGALFGRDHSTVIHASKIVSARADEHPQFRHLLERIEAEVRDRVREQQQEHAA